MIDTILQFAFSLQLNYEDLVEFFFFAVLEIELRVLCVLGKPLSLTYIPSSY